MRAHLSRFHRRDEVGGVWFTHDTSPRMDQYSTVALVGCMNCIRCPIWLKTEGRGPSASLPPPKGQCGIGIVSNRTGAGCSQQHKGRSADAGSGSSTSSGRTSPLPAHRPEFRRIRVRVFCGPRDRRKPTMAMHGSRRDLASPVNGGMQERDGFTRGRSQSGVGAWHHCRRPRDQQQGSGEPNSPTSRTSHREPSWGEQNESVAWLAALASIKVTRTSE